MLNCATNYHDDLFSRLIGGGVPLPVAVERVAGAYLDGKPLLVGKRKLTKKERDSLFWSSNVVKECLPVISIVIEILLLWRLIRTSSDHGV